jgi:hypothetical protein
MASQLRNAGNRRRNRIAQPTSYTAVRTPLTLYSGEAGESFILPIVQGVLTSCRSDGVKFLKDGPFQIYLAHTANGDPGRVITNRDICCNHGTKVKCRYGPHKCFKAHADLGLVMTGLRGRHTQVIGPIDPDLRAQNEELFTYTPEQIAKRRALNQSYFDGIREQLKRNREEEEAIEQENDDQAAMEEELARSNAKKAKRQAEATVKGYQPLVPRLSILPPLVPLLAILPPPADASAAGPAAVATGIIKKEKATVTDRDVPVEIKKEMAYAADSDVPVTVEVAPIEQPQAKAACVDKQQDSGADVAASIVPSVVEVSVEVDTAVEYEQPDGEGVNHDVQLAMTSAEADVTAGEDYQLDEEDESIIGGAEQQADMEANNPGGE